MKDKTWFVPRLALIMMVFVTLACGASSQATPSASTENSGPAATEVHTATLAPQSVPDVSTARISLDELPQGFKEISTDEILKAYKEVESAVERYIKLLHDHVTMLQNVEPPGSDKLVRMTAGSKAMTDSAAIYLSYAKYVAYGMPNSEEMIEDEIQG